MIWTMKPTAKKLEDVETKVGNVGNTDLQSQVNTLSSNIHNFDGSNAVTVSDYNSMTTPGVFLVKGTSSTQHPPYPAVPGRYFMLSVWKNGNFITQTAYSPSYGQTFMRGCDNGTWTEWQQFVLSSKAGDAVFAVYIPSVTFTNGVASIPVTKAVFGYEKIRCPIAMISSGVTAWSINSCDMANSNTTLRVSLNDSSINATLNIFVHYSAY